MVRYQPYFDAEGIVVQAWLELQIDSEQGAVFAYRYTFDGDDLSLINKKLDALQDIATKAASRYRFPVPEPEVDSYEDHDERSSARLVDKISGADIDDFREKHAKQ